MKIKIFTEAGSNIGLGHITRCMALYDEIIQRGISAQLIVYGDVQKHLLSDRNAVYDNWLDAKYLSGHISSDDCCIVDSYLADEALYSLVSEKSQKAIFIDDTARLEYPKGIIVNPSLSVDSSIYAYNAENEYLLGANYVILRTPFMNRHKSKINKEVKEVLVTLGGTDIRGIIPCIVEEICKKYPLIKFNIVAGNNKLPELKRVTPKNVDLFCGIDAQKMSELMLRSDLAITAAGQTIYELLAIGTPFIAIKVIENQNNNIRALKEINNEQAVIEHDDENIMEALKKLFDLMLGNDERVKFNKAYQNCIDCLGRARIINRLVCG